MKRNPCPRSPISDSKFQWHAIGYDGGKLDFSLSQQQCTRSDVSKAQGIQQVIIWSSIASFDIKPYGRGLFNWWICRPKTNQNFLVCTSLMPVSSARHQVATAGTVMSTIPVSEKYRRTWCDDIIYCIKPRSHFRCLDTGRVTVLIRDYPVSYTHLTLPTNREV